MGNPDHRDGKLFHIVCIALISYSRLTKSYKAEGNSRELVEIAEEELCDCGDSSSHTVAN